MPLLPRVPLPPGHYLGLQRKGESSLLYVLTLHKDQNSMKGEMVGEGRGGGRQQELDF